MTEHMHQDSSRHTKYDAHLPKPPNIDGPSTSSIARQRPIGDKRPDSTALSLRMTTSYLQRAAGNRAVDQLIASGRTDEVAANPHVIVQRGKIGEKAVVSAAEKAIAGLPATTSAAAIVAHVLGVWGSDSGGYDQDDLYSLTDAVTTALVAAGRLKEPSKPLKKDQILPVNAYHTQEASSFSANEVQSWVDAVLPVIKVKDRLTLFKAVLAEWVENKVTFGMPEANLLAGLISSKNSKGHPFTEKTIKRDVKNAKKSRKAVASGNANNNNSAAASGNVNNNSSAASGGDWVSECHSSVSAFWHNDYVDLICAHHKLGKSNLVWIFHHLPEESQKTLRTTLGLKSTQVLPLARLRSNLISANTGSAGMKARSEGRTDDPNNNQKNISAAERGLDLVRDEDKALTPRSRCYSSIGELMPEVHKKWLVSEKSSSFKIDQDTAAKIVSYITLGEKFHRLMEEDPTKPSHSSGELWQQGEDPNKPWSKKRVPKHADAESLEKLWTSHETALNGLGSRLPAADGEVNASVNTTSEAEDAAKKRKIDDLFDIEDIEEI